MFECVTFILAQQRYAVDIQRIREVRELEGITEVPGAGNEFCGIVEIRGKVVPIFDLRKMFGFEPTEQTDEHAVIIAKSGDDRIGYIVDAVTDIERIANEQMIGAESYTGLAENQYIHSVFSTEQGVTMIVDVDKILAVKSAAVTHTLATQAA